MDVTTIRLKTLYNPSKSIQAILKDRITWFCKKTPPHLVKVLVVFVNLRGGENRAGIAVLYGGRDNAVGTIKSAGLGKPWQL